MCNFSKNSLYNLAWIYLLIRNTLEHQRKIRKWKVVVFFFERLNFPQERSKSSYFQIEICFKQRKDILFIGRHNNKTKGLL